MTHLVVLPIVVAILTAIVAAASEHRGGSVLARIVSSLGLAIQIGLAILLVAHADEGTTTVYRLGNWPAPFAIVLVLDRMSALMIALTTVLVAFVVLAAAGREDLQARYFHPLLHFQAMGLYGAFLTGDIFNLFVFFEVLLIASYGLLLFGGGRERPGAGFQYIVLNLIGSSLFLIAVGTIYGVLGTLNMADVGRAAALASPEDRPLLQAAALLLVLVFALKGAIAPLHLWLPRTYCAASPAVAALFAIMTKVGVYTIARLVPIAFAPLFFPDEGAPSDGLLGQWLLPAALLSIVLATLGTLASSHLKRFVAFLVLMSAGTAALAISFFTPAGYEAALYYLVHSTLVLGAFFLFSDRVARARGELGDRLTSGPVVPWMGTMGIMFLVLSMAAVGLPPLSGFIGKILVLRAAWELDVRTQVWAVVLITSFLALVATSRVGSVLFWNAANEAANEQDDHRGPGHELRELTPDLASFGREFAPVFGLLAAALGIVIFAAPVSRYVGAAAEQALDRDAYIDAVLHDTTPPPKAQEVVQP